MSRDSRAKHGLGHPYILLNLSFVEFYFISVQKSRMALSNAPKVLFLDTIRLAKSQLSSFVKIANVVVRPVLLDLCASSPNEIQQNTSKTREEFLHDLGTKYKDVTGIYRHFKASESIKVSTLSVMVGGRYF